MRYTSRFEYKYKITYKQYLAIKNELTPYFDKDLYTLKGDDEKYFVSSIYYDTNDLKAFYERNDGIFGRIKLRIRTYSSLPAADSPISVELKTKSGNSMIKYSSLIPYSDYEYYLKNGHFENTGDAVLNEFFRLEKVRSLHPQLIVKYLREGFVPKIKGNVRITFDHNVESTRAKTLFEENLIYKSHRPKEIILEIKISGKIPAYLSRIIKKQNLKPVSNSKYVQGIELVSPLLITKTIGIEKANRG